MKKLIPFLFALAFITLFTNCSDEGAEINKNVIVTIYEDTGYAIPFMSDYWQEPLLFSDSENNEKSVLTSIITEGIDIYENYKRGYRYVYNAEKIIMKDPPEDASNFKYVFKKLISKEKIITENIQQELILSISDERVKFIPAYPSLYNSDSTKLIYEALKAQVGNTNEVIIIKEIEGFDYLEGNEYQIKVNQTIEVNPFMKSFMLIEIISSNEINKVN